MMSNNKLKNRIRFFALLLFILLVLPAYVFMVFSHVILGWLIFDKDFKESIKEWNVFGNLLAELWRKSR